MGITCPDQVMLLMLPYRKSYPQLPITQPPPVYNLERHFHGSCLDWKEFLRGS